MTRTACRLRHFLTWKLKLPDLEAEASLGLVRVDRERVPGHAVAPRAQATDAEPHHVALTLDPWSTRAPPGPRTSPPLNLGSSLSVK